ncbi:PAS domain-containing protein [Pseudomonas sp. SZMC_28357]|uniref:PAS domain-containing protein n=1 Tax=Pseudomonas sp. SZMC_28357 TaxID=3074380 RepID=UPI002870EC72|nr:PAS domain-containing protein [Pseudomonas sp. SZMC_28357]MDR9751364.1 PAS domain-containing protein [Pseudomonas sp. SZMC_28357]
MNNPLQRVVDALPALVWTATAQGDTDFLNQRWRDYTGLTVAQSLGRGWQVAVHADDLTSVTIAWEHAISTGEPYEVEHRLRGADGVFRWFNARGVPLRGPDGEIAQWSVLQVDIDEQKRTHALHSGEKRLLKMVARGRPLATVLTELCKLLDATAEGCFASVLLLDRSGKRVQQVIGPGLPASCFNFRDDEPFTCAAGPFGLSAKQRKQVVVADIEHDLRWADGSWPAHALAHGLKSCWSSPILSLPGELLGIFAIYRRDTGTPSAVHQGLTQQFSFIASIAIERAQSEDALKRSEAFLARAQHISATGSFSWHLGSGEITLSQQYCRIFELAPAEPITLERILARVHPDDRALMRDMIERGRTDGGDFDFDCRLLMPDQTVKYLQFANGAIRQNDQIEYIGAVRDVTSQRLSDEALNTVRSELAHVSRVASLGTLTASIAHEVNQPLSGIITNASTCLRMLGAVPPNINGALETARRTIRDGNRAAEVISRLRTLFSKNLISAEAVDLNEATREVLALIRIELQKNRVVVHLDMADDLPPVTCDRVQLQQVILNLLLNASEAMIEVHDRPRVMLITTAHDADDCVRLAVRDEGTGITAQDVERLFGAFYTTKADGMGMGLSISRSIIESHNGQLLAEPNDGPGATFWFAIPRQPCFDPVDDRSASLPRTEP